MTCTPIRFGAGNHVEDMILTSNVPSDTDINWLKNEWQENQARFSDLTSDPLVIEGLLSSQKRAKFFAIPSHNIPSTASVKVELFETATSTIDLLNMPVTQAAGMIPLGIWRVGVDPYGGPDDNSLTDSIIYWFDEEIDYQRVKISITHGYTPDPAPPSSGRYLQDSGGLISMEAENGEVELRGIGTWTVDADGNASNNNRMDKEGSKFYTDPTKGPRLKFKCTASDDGVHDVWIRCKPKTLTNSIYCIHEGRSVTKIIKPLSSNLGWYKAREISLVDGQDFDLIFAARDYNFELDKIHVQPSGSAAPTGTGDPESSEGVVGSSNNISLRMLMIGEEIVLESTFSYGGDFSYMTPPQLKQVFSGPFVHGIDQKPVRVFSLPMEKISDNDKMKMIYFERELEGRPFIVSPFNGEDELKNDLHTMLARFSSQLVFKHAFNNRHTATFDFVEV